MSNNLSVKGPSSAYFWNSERMLLTYRERLANRERPTVWSFLLRCYRALRPSQLLKLRLLSCYAYFCYTKKESENVENRCGSRGRSQPLVLTSSIQLGLEPIYHIPIFSPRILLQYRELKWCMYYNKSCNQLSRPTFNTGFFLLPRFQFRQIYLALL